MCIISSRCNYLSYNLPGAGRPLVLLLFNAGPLDLSWAQNSAGVHAIIECFFPAQAAGTAIAKILTGTEGANPAGRLPATWPAGMEQVSIPIKWMPLGSFHVTTP